MPSALEQFSRRETRYKDDVSDFSDEEEKFSNSDSESKQSSSSNIQTPRVRQRRVSQSADDDNFDPFATNRYISQTVTHPKRRDSIEPSLPLTQDARVLLRASLNGQTKLVQTLLESHRSGTFHLVSRHENNEHVNLGDQVLMISDRIGRTPIHLAVHSGEVSCLGAILDHIFHSIDEDCADRYQVLKSKIQQLSRQQSSLGLHEDSAHQKWVGEQRDNHARYCAIQRELKLREILNLRDSNGWTPVHFAAQCNVPQMMDMLLDYCTWGADLSQSSTHSCGGRFKLFQKYKESSKLETCYSITTGAEMQNDTPGHRLRNDHQVIWQHQDEITVSSITSARCATINNSNSSGCTPLHIATITGNIHVVKKLCRSGADETLVNMDDQTALDLAPNRVVRNALMTLDKAISRVVESKTMFSESTFGLQRNGHLEATNKHSSMLGRSIRSLVESGDDLNKQSGLRMKTPLHLAAEAGDDEVLDYLLTCGANPNVRDANGWTAMHYCALHATALHRVCVDVLLEHGGQEFIHFSSFTGLTPLHVLVSSTAQDNPNNRSTTTKRLAMLDLFIQNGALIDAVDDEGLTPFLHAAKKGSVKLCAKLVELGANLHAVTSRKQNALHLSMRQGYWAVAKTLCKLDSDDSWLKTYRDASGRLPTDVNRSRSFNPNMILNLAHVVRDGNLELTKRFIRESMPVDAPAPWLPFLVEERSFQNGYTSLHHVVLGYEKARLKNLEINRRKRGRDRYKQTRVDISTFLMIARSLIRATSPETGLVNIVDHDGRTPLSHAAQFGAKKMVTLLLESGASCDIQDSGGNTPVHWATAFGKDSVVTLLQAKGADMDTVNSRGESPSDLVGSGHVTLPRRKNKMIASLQEPEAPVLSQETDLVHETASDDYSSDNEDVEDEEVLKDSENTVEREDERLERKRMVAARLKALGEDIVDRADNDVKTETAGQVQSKAKFGVGSKVEAKFGGKQAYYSGVITKYNATTNSYSIDYDDGDHEDNVNESFIRLKPQAPTKPEVAEESNQKFETGSKVEAKFGGKPAYYSGIITKYNATTNTYSIDYDDGDHEVNVKESFIRLKPQAPTKPEVAEESNQKFETGSKVEAKFGGKPAYYSGVITKYNATTNTYSIDYDDGDHEDSVKESFIRLKPQAPKLGKEQVAEESNQKFETGSKVEAKFGGKPAYYSGIITKYNATTNTYSIDYDDGDHEDNVKESFIRLKPQAPTKPEVAEESNQKFETGSKVEAKFGGKPAYYSGIITKYNATTNTYSIDYDDGDHEDSVKESFIRLKPQAPKLGKEQVAEESNQKFETGSKVEAKFGGKPAYYSGIITKYNATTNTYSIDYDDGDHEDNVKESFIRLKPQGPTKPEVAEESNQKFETGSKVEAKFGGKPAYYSGVITKYNATTNTYSIDYDDGDHEDSVKESLIRLKPQAPTKPEVAEESNQKFETGSKVEAKFGGKQAYYSGVITKYNATTNTYSIDYDDGDHEDNVKESFIRLKPQAPTKPEVAEESNQKFETGSKVEAKFGGKPAYYSGVITKYNATTNSYSIDYDDGDHEDSVKESFIRLKPQAPTKPEVAEESNQKFETGSKVEAKFGGKQAYYSGVITKYNATTNTYSIDYDDGDHEGNVKESFIRLKPQAPTKPEVAEESNQKFETGSKVEAKFGGKQAYYSGVITKYNATTNSYSIDYDDGDHEDSVKESLIRTTN